MSLSVFDHLLVVTWVLLVPAFAALVAMPRLRRAGEHARRLRTYARTLGMQWTLTAVLVALWVSEDRPWADLGLRGAEWWRSAGGAVLVGAALVGLTVYRRSALADEETRRALQPSMERLRPMLPRTRTELGAFFAVSATAGIAEELFFRGYLIVYLGQFVPLGVAVALAVVVFGAGHIYQGRPSTVQTAGLGAVFFGLYALSGSLWLPMLFHAAFDMNSGALGAALLRFESDERGGEPTEAPSPLSAG